VPAGTGSARPWHVRGVALVHRTVSGSLGAIAAAILPLAASCTDLEEPSEEATTEHEIVLPCAAPWTTAAELQLDQLAMIEAPGMQRENRICAHLGQGERIEQTVTLQASKCYTMLGVSPDGVTNLDLTLVAVIPGQTAPLVLARETTTGSVAIIGGKVTGGYCLPWPFSLSTRLEVVATSGAGTVAAQVYWKAR